MTKEVLVGGLMNLQIQSRRRIIIGIILLGLICVSIVMFTAYATELRVGNNKLISNIESLQSEVDSLHVRIKQANNIERIEEIATTQLGMVYPDGDQCVYLAQQDAPMGNLAMVIKENAYG